jgi:hypothetical protein
MKRHLLVSVLLPGAILCTIAASSASAQTEPPPAVQTTTTTTTTVSSRGGGGGRIGVGGIAYLGGGPPGGGLGGLSVAYDPGPWHLDTMIGLAGGNNTANEFRIGGRFWYHLLSAASADLSIGAGLSYEHIGTRGPAPSANNLFIEAGGLIRVFLAPNVALGTAAGLVIGTADASGYSIGDTNLVATASIHYYF